MAGNVNITETTISGAINDTTVRRTPSVAEIILPPYFLLCLSVAGIYLMVLLTRHSYLLRFKKKNKVENWEFELTNYYQIRIVKETPTSPDVYLDSISVSPDRTNFLSKFDKEVIQSLKNFYNNFGDIISICVPALVTLFLGPILILFYYAIRDCFWPIDKYPVLPNINQCVSCFLTPAGLVYAISFGFAFQQALGKQNDILIKMTEEISMLDQAATLATKIKLESNTARMNIFKAIKAEAIYMICQIQKKKFTSFKYKPEQNFTAEIWNIVDNLREVSTNSSHYVDKVITKTIISYISQLNSVCSDEIGVLHSKLHWLKWGFLVSLGFFSLFGVLLIQAYSYKMELMMASLTLVSIAMLCYIVADLDSPFSGFFRIDISILIDVITRLEVLYKMADEGYEETFNFPDSSKFKSNTLKRVEMNAATLNSNTEVLHLKISTPKNRNETRV